ncbi:mycofactocin precursor MftA [Nocardioidaceae bacterium]|nr:mycofactocin precursor MftA [Nocardioidaceae bacterium]
MNPDTPTSADTPTASPEETVTSEMLIEEVSIDGMCGVY